MLVEVGMRGTHHLHLGGLLDGLTTENSSCHESRETDESKDGHLVDRRQQPVPHLISLNPPLEQG
jgi:hypothetical protein